MEPFVFSCTSHEVFLSNVVEFAGCQQENAALSGADCTPFFIRGLANESSCTG